MRFRSRLACQPRPEYLGAFPGNLPPPSATRGFARERGPWSNFNDSDEELVFMMRRGLPVLLSVLAFASVGEFSMGDEKKDNVPPEGFVPLFNGRDLTGWKGLVGDPKSRAKMSPEMLAEAQKKADESMRAHWKVVDGVLVFDGKGENLCTVKDFGDFELLVDWKILEKGDSGIYVRGSPQIQIWDPVLFNLGSGGLYNNEKNPSKPLVQADNPIGEWNTFRIKMVGEKVTVHLNDKLVVDNVTLENYWERDKPIYEKGSIELQNHGNTLYFKNIYIKEP